MNKIGMEVAWRLASCFAFVSGKEPILTRETAKITNANYQYMADQSRVVLGLTYHKLEDTIADVCDELFLKK